MKRILFVLLAFGVFSAAAALAQPKLEIQGGDTYNWKDVKPNDSPLKADIVLKNTGNETLKITNVKPTCGCTTAPLDKNELKPGESTVMHVSLRIGSRSGAVSKTIYISSNDPTKKRKVLWLKANVVREIEIGPNSYFSFDEMQVGTSEEVSFWVKNNSKEEVTLSDYEVKPDNVSISLASPVTLAPGEKIDIKVKAKPEKKGYFNVRVRMSTSNDDYRTLKIDGFGKVKESPIFNNN